MDYKDIKDIAVELQAAGIDVSTETGHRRVECSGDVHGIDDLTKVMHVLRHFEYRYDRDLKEHTFVHTSGIQFTLKDWWLEGFQLKHTS